MQVDLQQPVDVLGTELLEPATEGHPGVVDQQADRLVLVQHVDGQPIALVAVGQVHDVGADP